eukprot:c19778_g1_i5.p1 GENE.c19778_g1_i5~~c19778_g1_i5.p1  ORF type:complete len:711 (-),score=114.01 c19778_g1_i5:41-2173(-)
MLLVWNDMGKWATNTSYKWADMQRASGSGPTSAGDYFACNLIPNATFCTSLNRFVSWTGYCFPFVCTPKNVRPAVLAFRSSSLAQTASLEFGAVQALTDKADIEADLQRELNITTDVMAQIDVAVSLLLGAAAARLQPTLMNHATTMGLESVAQWNCGTNETSAPGVMWVWLGAVISVVMFCLLCTGLDVIWSHYPASLVARLIPAPGTKRSHLDLRSLLSADTLAESAVKTVETDGGDATAHRHISKQDWRARGFFGHCVKMFSLIRNWQQFVSVREGPLQFLDGVRVMACAYVILGHTEIFVIMISFLGNTRVVFPSADSRGEITRLFFQIIPGGYFAVDTFFWVAGFLSCFALLSKARKMPRLMFLKSIPLIYVARYLRLLPSVLLVLGVYWYVLPNVGSGPFWPFGTENSNDRCTQYWWAEVFFLSGWRTSWIKCISVTWYLTADLFYFLFTPFVVLLHLRWPKFTPVSLSALAVACTSYIAYLSHQGKVWSNMLNQSNDAQSKIYFFPLCRANPYIVGVGLGVLFDWVKHHRHGKLPMSHTTSLVLQATGVAIISACVFSLEDSFRSCVGEPDCPNSGYAWTQSGSDAYNALSRLGFAIGLNFLAIPIIYGPSPNLARWVLTRPIFSPWAKTTFMAFLWHVFFVDWFYGSSTTPIYYSRLNTLIYWGGFMLCAFMVATVSHLCVEAPFGNLQSHFLERIGLRGSS